MTAMRKSNRQSK